MEKVKMINHKSLTTLDEIIELATKGEVKGVLVAGFNKDGKVVTGWADIDCCQQQTLIGHLQVDLMNRFIKANYVTE